MTEEIGPFSRSASEAGWMFKRQKRVTRTESRCDTDHAGCIRTRKSVSCCALMLGNSTVSTYCKGQAMIALSSSEAEYYGVVSVTSRMLGICRVFSWTGDGNPRPTCGWMPRLELRLGVGEGSDE